MKLMDFVYIVDVIFGMMVLVMMSAPALAREKEFSGFFSGVILYSNEDIPYTEHVDNNGSLDDTLLGVRWRHQVYEGAIIDAQVSANGVKNFALTLDWANMQYQLNDFIGVKFGRHASPVGLFAGQQQGGFNYWWIKLPQTMYNLQSDGPHLMQEAYTGLALSFHTAIRQVSINLSPFYGESKFTEGELQHFYGINLRGEFLQEWQVLLGFNRGMVNINDILTQSTQQLIDDEFIEIQYAGISGAFGPILFRAEVAQGEFGDRNLSTRSDYRSLAYRLWGNTIHYTVENWHSTGGWGEQASIYGIRHDFNKSTAVKFEWKKVEPSRVNRPASQGVGLFAGIPTANPVNIYGFSIESIF